MRSAKAALTALLVLISPLAQAAEGTLASSERLRLRAAGEAFGRGDHRASTVQTLRHEMRRQGYYHKDQGFELTQASASIAPWLAWDDNINGGVLQDRFTLYGLTFEVDPSARARAGIVAGASAQGKARMSWAEGRSLTLAGFATLGASPRHRLGRADLALQLCSNTHLAGWSFLDLCAEGQRAFRKRGIQSYTEVSASFAQVIAGAGGLHDLRFALQQARLDEGGLQPRLRLSAESLWPTSVTDAALTIGRAQLGKMALARRLELGVTLAPRGRVLRFDVWGQNAGGGWFLGRVREDRSLGAGLTLRLRPNISTRLGVIRARSTAAIADYRRVTMNVQFNGLWRGF